MDWLRIYFDFTEGLFYFFTLEFFAPIKNEHYIISKKNKLRFLYLIYTFLYAFPEHIPFGFILDNCITFLYIFFISNHHFKTSIIQFLKFNVYIIVSTTVIYILYSYLANDFSLSADNSLYFDYKSLICSVISYAFPCLFFYTKRLIALRNQKRYGISFCISIALSIFVLSFLSLALLSGEYEISQSLPVIFSLIFIIIAICLTGYNHILLSLEENARQQVLISKYELETAYYQNMKISMDTLRTLRHDFKNHLIILNGYAVQNDYEKLQIYLQKINDTITEVQMIQTPHDLTSAILNAKALLCRQKNISFEHKCRFSAICISDFHLITVLGNLLDNAITAAGKLQNGSISLSIEQTEAYLSIICENTHSEKIIKKDGAFISTKENAGLFHGLGIKNIQNSVDTLNGTLDIQYTDSLFTVSILLPNYA